MAKTVFEAEFEQTQPSTQGADRVRFLISPNPGDPLKPLSTTASGGELSRIMLALKSITAQRDGIGTMIFDEIDTGISGRVAIAVGKDALHRAGQAGHCVTHLAPIAVMGGSHFLIEKKVEGERTLTTLHLLSGQERVAEIARLTGGGTSPAALEHAAEMLREASGA
jgi:DNA repair protein RecN (Recombination protein N)